MLRDAGLAGIDPADGRRIEVVATGLPMLSGVPIAIDATVVSPLNVKGEPQPRAAEGPGVALADAIKDKETTYPELLNSPMLRLVTAATETGGRMNPAAKKLIRAAAAARARSEPSILQAGLFRALYARWVTMISVAVQDAVAASLVLEGCPCWRQQTARRLCPCKCGWTACSEAQRLFACFVVVLS